MQHGMHALISSNSLLCECLRLDSNPSSLSQIYNKLSTKQLVMKVNIHFQTNDASLSLSPLASWLLSLCTHLTTLSTSFIFPGQVAPRQREAAQPAEMRITDRTIMLIKLEIIWFWMLLYFVDDGLNQLPMVQGQSADRPTAHDSPPAAQPTRPPGLPAWKNRKKSINTPSAHAYNTLYTTCAKHMRSWEEMGRI